MVTAKSDGDQLMHAHATQVALLYVLKIFNCTRCPPSLRRLLLRLLKLITKLHTAPFSSCLSNISPGMSICDS